MATLDFVLIIMTMVRRRSNREVVTNDLDFELGNATRTGLWQAANP